MADEGRERPPDPGVERVNELMSPCNGKCAEVSVRMGAGGVCGEHSRPVAREQEEESSEPLTQEPPVEEGSVRQGGEVRRDHGQVVDRAMEPSIILGHELGPRLRCGDSKCGSCDRALAKSWGKEEAILANQPLAGTRVEACPIVGCSRHSNAAFQCSTWPRHRQLEGAKVGWSEKHVLSLRDHVFKQHTFAEFLAAGVTADELAFFYGIYVCEKCDGLAKYNMAAFDFQRDFATGGARPVGHVCGPSRAVGRVSVAGGGVGSTTGSGPRGLISTRFVLPPIQLGGDGLSYQPPATLSKWLRAAISVVDRYSEPQHLPPCPPMRRLLRLSASHKEAVVSLIKEIDEAMVAPNMSPRDVSNVWKVWLFGLPRMLFCANGRDSVLGHEAAVAQSLPQAVARLVAGDAAALWNGHLRLAEAAQDRGAVSSGDARSQREMQDVVHEALAEADPQAGLSRLRPQFRMVPLSESDAIGMAKEVFCHPEVQHQPPAEVVELASSMLKDAMEAGHCPSIDALPPGYLFQQTHLAAVLAKYSAIRSPQDALGWRNYFIKLLSGWGAEGHLLSLLERAEAGTMPEQARGFYNMWQMYCLQEVVEGDSPEQAAERKQRLIHPTCCLQRTASSAHQRAQAGALAESLIGTGQVAVGVPGGPEILAHVHEWMSELAPENWVALGLDLKKFFYRLSRPLALQVAKDAKMWGLIMAIKSKFAHADNVLVCKLRGGGMAFLPSPVNGVPPGDPWATALATMAIGHCVKEAQESVWKALLAENVGYELRAKELFTEFASNVVLLSDVDDITIAGRPSHVLRLSNAFAASAHHHNLGTFQPSKSILLPLGAGRHGQGGIIPEVELGFRRALSIALLDPARQQQARQACAQPQGAEQQQQGGIQDTELVAVVVDSRTKGARPPGKVVIDGYTAVGASLGNELFRQRLVEEKREAVIRLVHSEFALDSKQDALLLHTYGGGLAQITSLLRSVPPTVTQPVLADAYDTAVITEIRANILPTFGQSTLDYGMAQLPRRHGGLGLRSAVRLAPRAYLAGFFNAAQFVDVTLPPDHFLARMLRDIRDAPFCRYARLIHDATGLVATDFAALHGGGIAGGPLASPAVAQLRWRKFQAFATQIADELDLLSIKRLADVSQMAYLAGSQSPGASAIFTVFPTTTRTTFANDVVSVSFALRILNKNVCGFQQGQLCPSGSARCSAIVGGVSDSHMMWCPSYGATATHNHVVREIRDMFRMSDAELVVSNQEPTVMPRARGDLLLNGAITQAQFTSTGRIKGGDVCVDGLTGRGVIDIFDVTLVVPHSAKALEALRKDPSASLSDIWEKQKGVKYAGFYAKAAYKFRGLAFEYSGRMGRNVHALIRECARRPHAQVPGDAQWTAATFRAYWVQRLVSAVQVALAGRLLQVRQQVMGVRGHALRLRR